MPRRSAIILWTAVALLLALLGLVAALLVAGRIVFLSARAQRRSRPS